VSPDGITNRFDIIREMCGLEDVRFHDLRHAHVSKLLGAGIDATTVATRVGHASSRMTLDRYAHALPGADKAAAAVIGRMLPGHSSDDDEQSWDELGNQYHIEIQPRASVKAVEKK
jgi:integrase